MKGRLLLDVVVGHGLAILQLLPCENQTLLIGRDALLVTNLLLDVLNRVGRLHIEGDGFARECLDKDLHFACTREMAHPLFQRGINVPKFEFPCPTTDPDPPRLHRFHVAKRLDPKCGIHGAWTEYLPLETILRSFLCKSSLCACVSGV